MIGVIACDVSPVAMFEIQKYWYLILAINDLAGESIPKLGLLQGALALERGFPYKQQSNLSSNWIRGAL